MRFLCFPTLLDGFVQPFHPIVERVEMASEKKHCNLMIPLMFQKSCTTFLNLKLCETHIRHINWCDIYFLTSMVNSTISLLGECLKH